ncbi:hypothetical protein [Micromonospora sp. CB01531]|nr:hypothetical protein [Micromonospora sp. CB01531]
MTECLSEVAAIPLDQPLGDRLTAAGTALRAHLDRIGAVLRRSAVSDATA